MSATTALDRIKRAKVAILRHNKFVIFSGVMSCGKLTLTDAIPTACTNGFDISFSPAFVGKLSDSELRFVLLHECMHIAFKHLAVWRRLWDEDKRLANMAADAFVNLALVEMDAGEGFIAMPKMGVQPDPQFHGWSVGQIYDYYKQNPDEQPSGGGGDNPDDPDGEGGGFDQHDVEGADKRSKEQQAKDAQEIDRALRQGEMLAMKRGQGGGNRDGVIGDLLTPKNNWRQLLRDFVQEVCQGRDESTWARPNRRFIGEDVYMPSSTSETMGELVVIFDTSGSCFEGSVITRFMSELVASVEAAKPSKCYAVFCDYAVQGVTEIVDGQIDHSKMVVRGGGGTDLTQGFVWCKENRVRPQAAIVFTDGYTPFGTAPEYPVLWVMTSKGVNAPYGRNIHMEV